MHGPEIVSATILQSKTKVEIKDKEITSVIIFDSGIQNDYNDQGVEGCIGSDEKLIYYFPSFHNFATKYQQMSVFEGLLSISSLLLENGELINYLKTRQYEIVFKKFKDTEIIICLFLQLPHIKINTGGITNIEYLEDDVYDKFRCKIQGDIPEYLSSQFRNRNNNFIDSTKEENNREALLSILDRLIETFSLLHGKVTEIKKKDLTLILQDFIPKFIKTIDITTLSITTSLNGFYFAPVERQTQISIINLVEGIIRDFSIVSHVSVLFDAHLLYSTLDNASNKILYNYLVMQDGIAMNDKLCNLPYGRSPNLSSLKDEKKEFSTFGRSNNTLGGEFLFGPTREHNSNKNMVFSPEIFLPCSPNSGYKLIAFLYREIMIVLLLDNNYGFGVMNSTHETESNELEYFDFSFKVRDYAINSNGGIAELYDSIHEQFTSIMNSSDSFRFFYINKSNSAIRRSNRLLRQTNTLMSSTEGDFILKATKIIGNNEEDIRSFIYKSENEGWIVCKKSLDRTYYLFFEDCKIPLSKIIEVEPIVEFNKYKILVVIISALFASVFAELLSYLLFFRKDDFIKLQDNIDKLKIKLDKLRLSDKTGIITENTTVSSRYLNKTRKNPKIESLEQSIANLNYKLSLIKMKSGLLVGVLFAALVPLKNTFFGDLPICKLPFEPIQLFRLVTQAGLKDASANDAGSIFIFGQAFMAFRMAIQKAVYLDASSSLGRV
ncbi:Integral membrane protein DUF106 family protein [Cryptosporidium felis]|nr:Integral membrane protein DUF106 family protein [Cryptosporidium felis]